MVSSCSRASPFFDEDAELGAAADADHDRHRCGEAEGAGAGDDEDGDGVDDRVGEARLGADEEPKRKREEGDHRDGGDEPAGDAVGEALDGRAGALGVGDELDDAGEQGVGADFFGAEGEAAGGVDGAGGDGIAGGFFGGDGFAGEHGFVDGGAAVEDGAVDGDLRTGADAKGVADVDVCGGDFLVVAGGVDADGGGRGEVEEGFEREGGVGAGAELEHLSEKDEDDDDGGGFEVDIDGAVFAHRGGEEAGREEGDDAETVGGGDAEGDQREHVPVAAAEGAGAADEERPAGPEDDGGGEEELRPLAPGGRRGVRERGDEVRHAEEENGNGERRAGPEAAGHVAQLVIFFGGCGEAGGFERHAAEGAIAGMILLHLGVHGAGVDRFGRGERGGRIALERHAAFRAVAGTVGFDALAHRAEVGGVRARRGVGGRVVMMVVRFAAFVGGVAVGRRAIVV